MGFSKVDKGGFRWISLVEVVVKIAFIVIAILSIGFLVGYALGSLEPPATTTATQTLTVPVIHTTTAAITTRHTTTLYTTAVETKTTTEIRTIITSVTVAEATTRTLLVTTTATRTTTVTELFRETVFVGVDDSISVLVDRDYYRALLELISRANRSIYVMMYVVKYDSREFSDPVNTILHEIARALGRGVDVRVVVDDATLRSYPETIEFLKAHGVPVKLDESGSTAMHAKIVIVDGLYVFVGSHNWTESALSYNREASILIKSSSIAQRLKEYFTSVWSGGRTP